MGEFGPDTGVSAMVAVSVAVAIALPSIVAWRLTPALLREHYVLSRPGRVVATTVVLLVVLSISGVVVALAATAYPLLWATEALVVSGFAAILIYVVRYLAAARAYEGEKLDRRRDRA